MPLGRVDRRPRDERSWNELQVLFQKYLLSIPVLLLGRTGAREAEGGCLGHLVGEIVPYGRIPVLGVLAGVQVNVTLNLRSPKTHLAADKSAQTGVQRSPMTDSMHWTFM